MMQHAMRSNATLWWAELLFAFGQAFKALLVICNRNWIEWSTIQGVIVRVISKSFEREARSRFEIMSTITHLIIKITISSIVIGLENSYFPLIHLSSCYRTVCYRTPCYRTVCYRTVQ